MCLYLGSHLKSLVSLGIVGPDRDSPSSVSEDEVSPRRVALTHQASARHANQAVVPIHAVDNQDQCQ